MNEQHIDSIMHGATVKEYYVLLTVRLGIFLVNNQLDTQLFFIICLFQFSTCFEQPCAHHQESIVSIRHLVYVNPYM